MSVDIKLKHSSVKDKKPTASDLKLGEVALNINEQSVAACEGFSWQRRAASEGRRCRH